MMVRRITLRSAGVLCSSLSLPQLMMKVFNTLTLVLFPAFIEEHVFGRFLGYAHFVVCNIEFKAKSFWTTTVLSELGQSHPDSRSDVIQKPRLQCIAVGFYLRAKLLADWRRKNCLVNNNRKLGLILSAKWLLWLSVLCSWIWHHLQNWRCWESNSCSRLLQGMPQAVWARLCHCAARALSRLCSIKYWIQTFRCDM